MLLFFVKANERTFRKFVGEVFDYGVAVEQTSCTTTTNEAQIGRYLVSFGEQDEVAENNLFGQYSDFPAFPDQGDMEGKKFF